MTKYCLGFLFDSNCAKVVLIRKNKPEWQAGRLNGLGGKIEEGETPENAMRREFNEEAGVDVGWGRFAEMVFGDAHVYCFCAEDYDGDLFQHLRSRTDEKVEVHDIRKQSEVIPNLRWLIPMAINALKETSVVVRIEYL